MIQDNNRMEKDIYCFIPSWYSEKEKWYTRATPWYRKGIRMEFDDTVNQIKMFQDSGEQVRLILLGYMPELRNLLHREGIRRVDVWSAFDVIQGVKGQKAGIFSYRDISWPGDLEWVYTPFVAAAYRKEELYAQVEFGEGGHMIEIVLFFEGKPGKRFYVDDRGFLSCLIHYSEEKEIFREYYNQDMQWQIREDVATGIITVNPEAQYRFEKAEYPNIDALICEIFAGYLKDTEKNNTWIVAFDDRHNELVRQMKDGRKVVLSLFEKRNPLVQMKMARKEDLEWADLLVTDTEYSAEALRDRLGMGSRKVLDISPYDARVSLGKSQRIRKLKILLYIGRLDAGEMIFWLDSLLSYVNDHRNTVLVVGLGMDSEEMLTKEEMEAELEKIAVLGRYGNIHVERSGADVAENEVKEEVEKRVFVRSCKTETEIIGVLKDIRIIVDAGPQPDLYMQIAGVSAGVPQILRMKSKYVAHKENGWILDSRDQLPEALDFFLKGLVNWNHSLIYSIRKIAQFTNGEMVNRWKAVLEKDDNA